MDPQGESWPGARTTSRKKRRLATSRRWPPRYLYRQTSWRPLAHLPLGEEDHHDPRERVVRPHAAAGVKHHERELGGEAAVFERQALLLGGEPAGEAGVGGLDVGSRVERPVVMTQNRVGSRRVERHCLQLTMRITDEDTLLDVEVIAFCKYSVWQRADRGVD